MTLIFSGEILARVVEELQVLVGGQVQRILQPTEFQVVLAVWKSGSGEKHLLLDCSPNFYRAHLTNVRAPKAATLFPFCAALRKYIQDGRIVSIAQRAGDRILDLTIENHAREFLLTCELMGKHSNLILVDDRNQILHAAKLINHKQSRVRQVLPGREYSPPPTRSFELPVSGSDLKNSEHRAGNLQLSVTLDNYYSREAPRAEFENQKRALLQALQKTLAQKQIALAQLRRGAEQSTHAEKYRRWGELILANMHAVKTQLEQGAVEIEVVDFYSENQAPISIALDEKLSASENAARYFARARHIEENGAALHERAQNWERETAQLAEFLRCLETLDVSCEDFSGALKTLRELHDEAASRRWLRAHPQRDASTPAQKLKPEFDGHKIKKLISPDGFEVLVGESATANDFLVTRLAHSEDWWLHVRGATSAHAIIKTNKAPQRVPLSTLAFAAQQVAQRSVAKHASLIEVDYTLKKYVRKPRKAPPGSVAISNQKTLRIENQEIKK